MTIPATKQTQEEPAPTVILEPSVKDANTGALWVHQDYIRATNDYAHEEHERRKIDEKFGDVESWTEYVKTYGLDGAFCTWSAKGLNAVLDYPDTRLHFASHPFTQTPEFRAWSNFANGGAHEQKKAVEFLEDHAPDIFEPNGADLLTLLRSLTANASATAAVTMREDGTADLAFTRSSTVSGPSSATLPAEITITVPVLRGHVEEADDLGATPPRRKGDIVRYKLVLKVRASVDANAHLALRFTMPQSEVVLEQVFAERVLSAKSLLGDAFSILRAAD